MKYITKIIPTVATIALLAGCAVVDVTKTAQGYFPPTNPNTVMILKTIPPKKYVELGTVTVTRFRPTDTAKMHNAIRTKAAPLGADAVVLTEEGILPDATKWATGVAIKFQ
jgi:hypothetical protein